MPKRIIDGEALWRSEKLAKVEPRYRAEYSNLIPLADAQGIFEANPRKVWADVYSCNRTDVQPEDVAQMLDAFERVKMIFRWREPDGKLWGFFIGIDKPGRLPSPSRLKENHYQQHGPALPTEQLQQFLSGDSTPVGNHTLANGQPEATRRLADGSDGLGSGDGGGGGSGKSSSSTSPKNGADEGARALPFVSTNDNDERRKTKPKPPTKTEIEAIYKAYPRHVGKQDALKAISSAILRVSTERHCDLAAAVDFLNDRTTAFAKSPAGQSGKFTPHPATWFNAGRYDDAESEWANEDKSEEKPRSERRMEQSLAAIDRA